MFLSFLYHFFLPYWVASYAVVAVVVVRHRWLGPDYPAAISYRSGRHLENTLLQVWRRIPGWKTYDALWAGNYIEKNKFLLMKDEVTDVLLYMFGHLTLSFD